MLELLLRSYWFSLIWAVCGGQSSCTFRGCGFVEGCCCIWVVKHTVFSGLLQKAVSEDQSFYDSEEHTVLLTFHHREYSTRFTWCFCLQNSALEIWITMFCLVYPVTASTWRPNSINTLENMLLSWVRVGQRSNQVWGTWVALRFVLPRAV